jgi:hypothetical protein
MTSDRITEATRLAVGMQAWDAVPLRLDCPCTWTCSHRAPCPDCTPGQLRHLDRYPYQVPASGFTGWVERYECDNPNCYPGTTTRRTTIPDRPWGYLADFGFPVAFPGLWTPANPLWTTRPGRDR